jgi:hypothetical protein
MSRWVIAAIIAIVYAGWVIWEMRRSWAALRKGRQAPHELYSVSAAMLRLQENLECRVRHSRNDANRSPAKGLPLLQIREY